MMNSNPHILFTASGCLTPEAFKLMSKNQLSDEELMLAKEHIRGCELCSIASEGLSEVDMVQLASDLNEVHQKLKVIRPLDFMHEKRGVSFKIKIRIITLSIITILIAAVAYIINIPLETPGKNIVPADSISLYRLEVKDTATFRLERKLPNKKAKWEKQLKEQTERKRSN